MEKSLKKSLGIFKYLGIFPFNYFSGEILFSEKWFLYSSMLFSILLFNSVCITYNLHTIDLPVTQLMKLIINYSLLISISQYILGFFASVYYVDELNVAINRFYDIELLIGTMNVGNNKFLTLYLCYIYNTFIMINSPQIDLFPNSNRLQEFFASILVFQIISLNYLLFYMISFVYSLLDLIVKKLNEMNHIKDLELLLESYFLLNDSASHLQHYFNIPLININAGSFFSILTYIFMLIKLKPSLNLNLVIIIWLVLTILILFDIAFICQNLQKKVGTKLLRGLAEK